MDTPTSLPQAPPSTDKVGWFSDNILAHEPALKSYLRQAFPTVRHDVDDVVQECYLRIWTIRAEQPLYSAKAFLFKVARNVTLDLLRHRSASPINAVGDLAALPAIEEGRSGVETSSIDEKLRLLASGLATVSPRGREIIMLRKFKGVSQRDTATALGLSEKTVAEHLRRAKKRLGRYLRQRGVSNLFDS